MAALKKIEFFVNEDRQPRARARQNAKAQRR